MRDRCKRCRAVTTHERRTSPHGREAWWCACGAAKHLLSAAALPLRVAL